MVTSPVTVCAKRANGIKKSLTTVCVATFSRSRQANGLEAHISRDVHCKFFPTTCNVCISPAHRATSKRLCLYSDSNIDVFVINTNWLHAVKFVVNIILLDRLNVGNVSTPASCLGASGFKPRSGDLLSKPECVVVFFSPFRQVWGLYPN